MEVKLLSKHHQIPKQINLIQAKKRSDILVSFLPDDLLRIMVMKEKETLDYTGVVLLIDIHELTEINRKITQEELFKENATTNAYLSAIIEVIHYYDGDIQEFSPIQMIVIWKYKLDTRLYSLIDDVVLCAMNIKNITNNFNMEMVLNFKIKQIISCGNFSLRIIGDKSSKSWVIEGNSVHDCQAAVSTYNGQHILLSTNAWGHLDHHDKKKYEVKFTSNDAIEILKPVFQPDEKELELKYKSDDEELSRLCSEHLKFRNVFLYEMKIQSITTKYSSHINELTRAIKPRKIVKLITGKPIAKDLELFVVKHVTDKLREHQPLDYLTEIHEETTIQTIFLGVIYRGEGNWFNLINDVYCTIQKIAMENFGCIVNKQFVQRQSIVFVIAFGLHENLDVNYSQKALFASQTIIQELKLFKDLRNVNINITNQSVQTAVYGHPFRKNYFAIYNKTAKEPPLEYFKIICDEKTYENSKLPSNQFLLKTLHAPSRGINGEIVFEFIGLNKQIGSNVTEDITVIGRKEKLEYIENMLFNKKRADKFNAVVVKGLSKTGKSTILRKIMSKCENKRLPLAYLNLCGGKPKPYFCVSAIYRQLLDFHASKSKNPTSDYDANQLWNFADTLQLNNSFSSEDIRQSIKIFENFFDICKRDAEFSVVIIDNVQFIDLKSLQILEDVLKLNAVRIVSAGQFEEDKLDILWKFSVNENFKILNLKPLSGKFIPQLICHFLKVQGITKRIVELIGKVCDGRPGWIETCLLELLKKGDLQIRCLHYNEHLGKNIILPNWDSKNAKNNAYVRIALMRNTNRKDLDHLTPNAIAQNFFQSFPPYQQIIIKTASVIGDIFTRSLLTVILELRNTNVFTYAIKCLFDEEIFECGSKYFINNAKIIKNDLSCVCYTRQEDQVLYQDFPKYAFCKILHFRNRIIRKIAYELLSVNQRKDLHLKITELLEYETILCPQCSQHRPRAIIKIKKYKDMIVLFEAKSEVNPSINIKEIKEVIKREITDARDVDGQKENEALLSKGISIEKFWNSSTCFCLEIFTRIYSDLVHHSQRADHLAKQIFFMYQYGSILILIGELEDAISLLKEASQLCVFGDLEKHQVSNDFTKFIFSRIVTSIAEAYYYLDNYKAAKNYILLCFRQQDIPLISMKYKLCFKLLRRNEQSVLDEYSSKSAGCEEYIGQTLAILMRILAAENQWKLALSVADKTISLLKRGNKNISLLCEVYNSALDISSIHGDTHTCEQLEKCVVSVLMQEYSINNPIEFFAIAKLMCTLFVIKTKTDNITNAIRIGYRLYHLNYGLRAEIFQMETVPILADLLVAAKRIDDAAYTVSVTRKMMKNTLYAGESLYFVFCCDLLLDTSFYLEKIDAIERFAEKMYSECDNTLRSHTNTSKYLIICLMTYFSRLCNWNKLEKWKCYCDIPNIFKNDYYHIKFKLRFLELNLLQVARSISSKLTKITVVESEFKLIKKLMKECFYLSRNWNFFLPKCYLYIGYHYKLKTKSNYKQYIKLGLKHAEINGNLSTKCWIDLNKNFWTIGHSNFMIFDFPFVLWKKAREYTTDQWTQIMFPLPLP